jgi:Pyrimidine dimer DNA glycosylase
MMRLWSLHPRYLDARGLVALWREGLLAQAVLRGETKGYVHHPQLVRFRERSSPLGLLAEYLRAVRAEALARGYRFAAGKIGRGRARERLTVTRGQLDFEWRHLTAKLERRDPERRKSLAAVETPAPHPLFRLVPGGVAPWEKAAAAAAEARPRRNG